MSSTFEWNDIAGAFPWLTDWMAGPSGQVSSVFFALSETHVLLDAGAPDDDDALGADEPPNPSGPELSVAAEATRAPPSTSPTTATESAARRTHAFVHVDRTRFIATSRTST
jgi:hypothetical protein